MTGGKGGTGGMKPAKKAEEAGAETEDEKPESMPAIPMTGGMKPTKKQEPEAPASGDEADEEKPEVIPAIPMTGGMKPAEKKADAIPAIPMGGGMKPATETAPVDDERAREQAVAIEVRARLTWHFMKRAGEYYGALLAAGRESEAELCAEILLEEIDDSEARAALLAHALRAGQFDAQRERHAKWLEEAWR